MHEHETLLAVDTDKKGVHDAYDAARVIRAHVLAHLVERVQAGELVDVEAIAEELREQALSDLHIVLRFSILANQFLERLLYVNFKRRQHVLRKQDTDRQVCQLEEIAGRVRNFEASRAVALEVYCCILLNWIREG